jgi:2-phospho-L-lactate guanylyltransferase
MAAIAKNYGVTVILEPRAAGLSAAATFAAEWGVLNGFDAQLLIPADIADLSAQEIETLLATVDKSPSVTVCAATDGGTNALLTSPPDAICFDFGFGSSRRHILSARQQGISCRSLRMPNLSYDIDTPADLVRQQIHFHRTRTAGENP